MKNKVIIAACVGGVVGVGVHPRRVPGVVHPDHPVGGHAVVEAVARSGRFVRVDMLTAMVCAVDGAVVSALVGDGDGPRQIARATLVDVIDVLAPIDERSLRA